MPQHTATWKNAEKKAAEILGGTRIHGARGVMMEDVSHAFFSVEVKHGKSIPKFVANAFAQAKRNAPEGKEPLVVLHAEGSRDYMAVLPLAVLADLWRRATANNEPFLGDFLDSDMASLIGITA